MAKDSSPKADVISSYLASRRLQIEYQNFINDLEEMLRHMVRGKKLTITTMSSVVSYVNTEFEIFKTRLPIYNRKEFSLKITETLGRYTTQPSEELAAFLNSEVELQGNLRKTYIELHAERDWNTAAKAWEASSNIFENTVINQPR